MAEPSRMALNSETRTPILKVRPGLGTVATGSVRDSLRHTDYLRASQASRYAEQPAAHLAEQSTRTGGQRAGGASSTPDMSSNRTRNVPGSSSQRCTSGFSL